MDAITQIPFRRIEDHFESGQDISGYLDGSTNYFPNNGVRLFFSKGNDKPSFETDILYGSANVLSLVAPIHSNDSDYLQELAILGIRTSEDALIIDQVQGIKPGILPTSIDEHIHRGWPKDLINIGEDIAHDHGYKELKMVQAEHLKHYNNPAETKPEDVARVQERMRKMYDGNAQQLGFALQPNGYFAKPLKINAKELV